MPDTVSTLFKCDHCGKFVGYTDNCTTDFIPDNAFGPEEFLIRCAKCSEKYGPVKSYQRYNP